MPVFFLQKQEAGGQAAVTRAGLSDPGAAVIQRAARENETTTARRARE